MALVNLVQKFLPKKGAILVFPRGLRYKAQNSFCREHILKRSLFIRNTYQPDSRGRGHRCVGRVWAHWRLELDKTAPGPLPNFFLYSRRPYFKFGVADRCSQLGGGGTFRGLGGVFDLVLSLLLSADEENIFPHNH